jgi:predicted Rdx family selenoprotein
MDGQVVHRWSLPYQPGNWGYLLENGNLLYAGNSGKATLPFAGGGGCVMEVDWDGVVVWEYEDANQHHDVSRGVNGNTMVLGWDPIPDGLVPQIQGGVPGTELDGKMYADYIHEVTPEGNVVWEWHAYEALDPKEDVLCSLHERHEWLHTNACTVLPDGNVLTSFRHLDTIGIVDRKTGKFAWKYHNRQMGHQHDPTLLENGNVLVFANGYHNLEAMTGSKIYEIDPRKDEIVWTYATRPAWEFFSGFISSAQRLPNGNTLICEGATGRLFEVTLEGEVVWEYVVPFFADHPRHGYVNCCFRARRYPPGFPGLAGRTLTPQP